MVWVIVYTAVPLAILGVGLWLIVRMVGKEDAIKQLKWFWPLLLFIFVQSFLMSYFDEWLGIVYFAYIAIFSAWFISWPFRKREAGRLLLDAGKPTAFKYIFWGGVIFSVIALITTIAFLLSNEPISALFFKEDIAAFWMLAIFGLSIGSTRLEVRENGICNVYRVALWRRMRAYEWGGKRTNMLTIKYKPRLRFMPGFIGFDVSPRYREEIDRIVATHVPDAPMP